MKKTLLLIALTVLAASAAFSQTPQKQAQSFHYLRGYAVLERSYRNTDENFRQTAAFLDSLQHNAQVRLTKILFQGYSSPDGLSTANLRLSAKRARLLKDYFSERLALPDSLIEVRWHGIDWHSLDSLVQLSDALPYREEVLDILRNTPVWIYDDQGRVVDGRKRQLGMLRGGVPYNWLYEHVFPSLRRSSVTAFFEPPVSRIERSEPIALPDSVLLSVPDIVLPEEEELLVPVDTLRPAQSDFRVEPIRYRSGRTVRIPRTRSRDFRPLISVKTNLLYWATLMPDFHSYTFVPNLELEWFFCDSWSLSGTGNYAKWNYGNGDFYGISTWSLEPRWWPGRKGTYRWFYLGVYGQMGDYDAQNDRVSLDGNTGKLWSTGISLGVAIPFTPRVGIEIGIRAGYRHSVVKEYVFEDPHYYLENRTVNNFWGVTGIKASLYYRFGSPKNKGGQGR